MRPTRAALLVAATALAPALLLTSPAFAAGSTATTTRAVASASGTPVDEMSLDDLRVEVFRILGNKNSGQAVVREATKALEADTADALRAFLETGYRLAQAEDDRVAIFRILADKNSGTGVIREA
ncbi:ALF repeat-containing protein, partial [Streptomyces nodosus]|uniref:ALF repeat-containing protein n=1 Tax=Streptomyces nodosus TaxID=40318 RepID=UPI0037FAF0F3